MKFKIVLIAFPFDDLSGTKVRPAVCLTDFISQHNHIIFAFITSNISAATELTDLIIEDSNVDFEHTGLKVSSVLKLRRLLTISDNIIQKVIGILPESYHTEVDTKLKLLFNLNN